MQDVYRETQVIRSVPVRPDSRTQQLYRDMSVFSWIIRFFYISVYSSGFMTLLWYVLTELSRQLSFSVDDYVFAFVDLCSFEMTSRMLVCTSDVSCRPGAGVCILGSAGQW